MKKNHNSSDENKSQPVANKKDTSNNILFIIIILLLVVIVALICAGGFLFWKYKDDVSTKEPGVETNNEQEENNESEENTDEDNNEEQDDQTAEQLFTKVELEYISAELLENWSIIEYEDGKGPSNLDEMDDFEGLTAIEIINPSNKVVYSIKALQGIGGLPGCSKIYKFSDTSEDYIQDQINPILDSETIDLSGKEYVEYEILGQEVRRIAKKIYWNVSDDEDIFNSGCGMNDTVKKFEGLYYSNDLEERNIYSAEITPAAKNVDLEILDKILESLEITD